MHKLIEKKKSYLNCTYELKGAPGTSPFYDNY